MLAGERYGGAPVYFSDVIVPADSPAWTFDDLAGCTWAYNDPASHSGRTVVLHRLLDLGVDASFFGRVVRSGFHATSIRLVAGGVVDASAVDSQVLAMELAADPSLDGRVRVIDTLGPSTIQPVTAGTHLPPAVRTRIADTLVASAATPTVAAVLRACGIDRIVAVRASDYDDIRAMTAAVDAAGLRYPDEGAP